MMEELILVPSSAKVERKEYVDLLDYVCATCVSQNRALHHLDKDVQELMIALSIKVPNVKKLCWECYALLKKVLRFKQTAALAQQILINKDWKSLDTVKLSRLVNTEAVKTTTPSRDQDAGVQPESKSSRNTKNPSKCVQDVQDLLKEKQDNSRKSCIVIQPPPLIYLNKTVPKTQAQPTDKMSQESNNKTRAANAYTNFPKIPMKPLDAASSSNKLKSFETVKVNTQENVNKKAYDEVLMEPTMKHKTIYLVDPRNPSDYITQVKVRQQQTKTTAYLSLGPVETSSADTSIPKAAQSDKNKTILKGVSKRLRTRPKAPAQRLLQFEIRSFPNTVNPALTKQRFKPKILKKITPVRIKGPPVLIEQQGTLKKIDLVIEPDEITYDAIVPTLAETQTKPAPKKPVRSLVKTKARRLKKIDLLLETNKTTTSDTVIPMLVESQTKSTLDDISDPVGTQSETPGKVDLVLETETISNPKFPIEVKTQTTVKHLASEPIITSFANCDQKTPETLNNLVLHHLVKQLYCDIEMNIGNPELEISSDQGFAPDSTKHKQNERVTTAGTVIDMALNPVKCHPEKTHALYAPDTKYETVNNHVLNDLGKPLLSATLLPIILKSMPETTSVIFPDDVTPIMVEAKPETEIVIETVLYPNQPKTLRHLSCVALNIMPEKHVDPLRTSDKSLPSDGTASILRDMLLKSTLEKVGDDVLERVEMKSKHTLEAFNDIMLNPFEAFHTLNKLEQNCIETNPRVRSETPSDEPIFSVPKITSGIFNAFVGRKKDGKPEQITSVMLGASETSYKITSKMSNQQMSSQAVIPMSLTQTETTDKTIDDGTRLPTTPNIDTDVIDAVVIQPNIRSEIDKSALDFITISQYKHLKSVYVGSVLDKTLETANNNVLSSIHSDPKICSTSFTSDTEIPVMGKTNQSETSGIVNRHAKMKPVKISKIAKYHVVNCNETPTLTLETKSNPADIILVKPLKTVYTYRMLNELYKSNTSDTTSPQEEHISKVNSSNIKDQNMENADGMNDFDDLPSLHCTENIQESEDLLADNISRHTTFHSTQTSKFEPNEDNIKKSKPENVKNVQELVVRRITAENSTSFNLNDEEEPIVLKHNLDGVQKYPKVIKPRVVYYYDPYNLIQSNISPYFFNLIIVVPDEYKHILRDHNYCANYVFNRLSGIGYNNKSRRNSKNKNRTLISRLSLKQQMTASEGYIKNAIQNIVDNFENEDSNVMIEPDQEQLITNEMDMFTSMGGRRARKDLGKEYRNKYGTNNSKKKSYSRKRNTMNNYINGNTDRTLRGVSNSISIDIKVEACDETRQDNLDIYDNLDWSVQTCQINPEQMGIEHEQTIDGEDFDTDTASETSYIENASHKFNYDRDDINTESDSEQGDNIKAPPGYIRDDTPQDYTDYELQPIESTSQDKDDFDNNLTICFTTAVFDSELNNAPVYSTDNTEINIYHDQDTNFNPDNEYSRNSTPNLLEPRYFTDWEDTTYDHVIKDDKEPNGNKKKIDLKNKGMSTRSKTNKKQLINPLLKRKRKCTDINNSDIKKNKKRRLVSKRARSKQIKIKKEIDVNEINVEKLLLQPVVLVDKLDAKKAIKRKSKNTNIPEEFNDENNIKNDKFNEIVNQFVEDWNLKNTQLNKPIDINAQTTTESFEVSDQMNVKLIESFDTFVLDSVPTQNTVKRPRITLRNPASLLKANVYVKTKDAIENQSNTPENNEQDPESKTINSDNLLESKDNPENKQEPDKTRKYNQWHEEYADMYRKRFLLDGELDKLREKIRNGKEFINAKYKCEKCVRVLSNKQYYTVHMTNYHETNNRHLECKICECKFDKSGAWKSHVARHNICYSCIQCDSEEYLYLRDLHEHVNLNHPKVPTKSSEVKKRRKRLRERQYVYCGLCKKPYEQKSWLVKHLKAVHNLNDEEIIEVTDDLNAIDKKCTGKGLTENILNPTENNSSLPENSSTTTENSIFVSGNSLSTTDNDLSLGESRLSITENDLSLAGNRLSTAENELSLAVSRLSTTENDLNNGEDGLKATENNLSLTGDVLTATEVGLSSSEINLIPSKDNLNSRDLICIDNNMIVMEYTEVVTEKELLTEKNKYLLTKNLDYISLINNKECSTETSKDKNNLSLIEDSLSQSANNLDQAEIDISSMGFTILDLQPTSSGQNQTTNNIIVMEKAISLSENIENMTENNTSIPDNCLSLTENIFNVAENNLSQSVSFELVENISSPEENDISVMGNNLIYVEDGKEMLEYN